MTGALTSGYQLNEDYEFFEIQNRLRESGRLIQTIAQYISEDFHRLRIYYPHRVLQNFFFGVHVTWMRVELALLGALSCFLLYRFARKINWDIPESLLLGLWVYSGAQMLVWWRMGTAENLGMFFLALALFFVETEFLFTASLMLMALSKETFMVIVPAILFLKIWLDSETARQPLWKSFRRHAGISAILGIFTLGQLVWILKITGPVVAGYAGYEGFRWNSSLNAFLALAHASHAPLLAITGFTAVWGFYFEKNRAAPGKSWLCPGAFFILMITPLVLLFQKSGVADHYVLPGVFAFSFLFLYAYHILKKTLFVFFRILILGSALTVTLYGFKDAAASGRQFAAEGRAVKTVVDTVREKTAADDAVLLVADPARHFEWSYAIGHYLEWLGPRKNLYLFPILRPNYSVFEKQLVYDSPKSPLKLYRGRLLNNIPSPDRIKAVVVLPTMEFWFLLQSKSWFDRFRYDRTTSGNFAVYCRKN